MAQPTAGRPMMAAGYGIDPSAPKDADWSAIVEKIAASRNYWICTTRADGRPHAMPVWGVVVEDAFCFGTDPQSVKGRNLARRADVVVHLESGDDVVIIEGVAERVIDKAVLTKYGDAYKAKYGDLTPDPHDPSVLTLTVRPKVALVWREKDFPTSAVRWTF